MHFEGCSGLVVTEEMRVLVAHRGLGPYSDLRSVLLYPDEFVVQRRIEDEAGVITEGGLAWNAGYNVVLHEFAHLLDPALDEGLRALVEAGHNALCGAVDAGRDTLIDPYGAEDPVEFFAVCTEAFFGLPAAFKSNHADLHAALVVFYGCDPATWEDSEGES